MSETARIGAGSNVGGITPAEAQAARGLVEDAQPWRINPWGRTDTAEIADGLAEMRLSDPEGAARVEHAVRGQLSATEQHHLSRDLETAQARADRALVLDATQIGIDLVGIVDPTGAADVAGAGLSVYRGDCAGAAISLVGLIPYAGDAAKLAKFGRWSDTVLNVARRAADSAEFAEKALPILRRIGDAIDALPQGVLDRMPAGARAKLDEMKAAIEGAVRQANTREVVGEIVHSGRRISPENVVEARRLPDGRSVWLETGNDTAGLQHILKEHGPEFAQRGIAEGDVGRFVMDAVENGTIVGYQGRGTGRPIYEFVDGGVTHRLAVTIGDNGFVVGANFRPTP